MKSLKEKYKKMKELYLKVISHIKTKKENINI